MTVWKFQNWSKDITKTYIYIYTLYFICFNPKMYLHVKYITHIIFSFENLFTRPLMMWFRISGMQLNHYDCSVGNDQFLKEITVLINSLMFSCRITKKIVDFYCTILESISKNKIHFLEFVMLKCMNVSKFSIRTPVKFPRFFLAVNTHN